MIGNNKPLSNELEWFQQFLSGNSIAYQTVFEKYYRSIYYYATLILKNDDIYTEDLVSETFQKAWYGRTRFENPKHLENFLYQVTRNACISRIRSSSTENKNLRKLSYLISDAVTTNDELDLERVHVRLIELLNRHLESMPHGNVLRMSYLDGKTTRQIAEELQTTENNIYIQKSRALKELRILMGKDFYLVGLLFLSSMRGASHRNIPIMDLNKQLAESNISFTSVTFSDEAF